MNSCHHCLKPTSNPKFCSRSCSAIHNNKTAPKRPSKPRPCSLCKNEFTPERNVRSTLCDVCRNTRTSDYIKTKTLAEYHSAISIIGKHPSWRNSHIRVLNRQWNKHLIQNPCRNCGYDKHVELCHIRPITDFPDTATVGEVNSESNNVPLCRNCHWEFDKGLITL